MVELISKYCNDSSRKTGLLLIDSPTGSGKTYSVMRFISDYISNGGNKKVFYITSLKTNLPENDLAEMFEKSGNSELFNRKFLRIKSNFEEVKNNWSRVKDNIPTDIKEHSTFKNLDRELSYLDQCSKKGSLKNLQKRIEDAIRLDLEPNFRKYVQSVLHNEFHFQSERLEAVKNNTRWKWLGELYPAVFTSEKQIFFLSMDKFLYGNSTIIESSYKFLNNRIVKESIIFIDEFDSTKDTILKKIISDNLQNKVDYVQLFRKIYWALNKLNRQLPSEFTEISPRYFDNMTKIAEDIYTTYNLNYEYKTHPNFSSGKDTFLFHDYRHHTIFGNDNENYLSVAKDCYAKICWIDVVPEKPSLEENSLFSLLTRIKGFLLFFEKSLNFMAHKHLEFKNSKRNPKDVEVSPENVVKSIISLFDLCGEYKEFILNGVMSHYNVGLSPAENTLDLSFYNRSFRYYDFIDSYNHVFQTQIIVSEFANTPEKILLRMCDTAKVIGISATATLNSVISNYDINYLKLKLKDRYYDVPKETQLALKNSFEQLNYGYKNVHIHVDFISGATYGTQLLNCWKSIFNNKEFAYSAHNLIGLNNSDDYNQSRYVKIAKAFKEFISHRDIQSFLCMLNKHPKCNDANLDRDVLEEIFNYIIEDILGENSGLSHENNVMYMQSEDFSDKKSTLLERLSNGDKIFVISAYQTIGVGQNLQYDFSDVSNLVKVNDRNSNQKDFDAIYLDKPTNILVNLHNYDDFLKEEEFIKYIYQVEFLQYLGEISYIVATTCIKMAFKRFMGHAPKDGHLTQTLYKSTSVKKAMTKVIIQAIGRICRTSYKNPNVYIYADESLIDILDVSTVDKPCNIEYQALINKVISLRNTEPSDELEQIHNQAINKSDRVYRYIMNNLLAFDNWSLTRIQNWQALRYFLLKKPGTSNECYLNENAVYNTYIQLPQKSDRYWYSEFNDYNEVDIHFDKKHPHDKEVSAKAAQLDILMEIPTLKDYFIENGYATDFAPYDYIMCPVMFNNIYKGILGEVAGKFIFENFLGYTLSDLDGEYFEKFDFYLGNGIYVDFKHWKQSFICDDRETIVSHIGKKLKQCNGRKVIVANILADENMIPVSTGENLEILEVPNLFSSKTKTLNLKAFDKIREFISR